MMKIKADENCPHCHGKGFVTDWVDYGSTHVPMNSNCECIDKQIPEDYTGEIEVEESGVWWE